MSGEPERERENSHSQSHGRDVNTAMELELESEDSAQHLRDHPYDKHQHGWRYVVRNFSPSWFSVNMGTGIASILLHQIPYNGAWLYWLSVIVFCLNILLFTVFLLISIVRYTVYPEIWVAMIKHPTQSLFIGTFPMGFATIVNMIILVCVPAFGHWAVILAWICWWIDAVVAVTTALYLPFIIMYWGSAEISGLTAAWLLPVVAPIVASASGALVAGSLMDPQNALDCLIVSHVLWGIGVPTATFVLIMYFHRLTLFHLPPKEAIVSVFLPLGPIGQGAYAIMQLSKVAQKVLPETGTLQIQSAAPGDVLYIAAFLTGITLWGFGLVWLFFALASITRSRFPFNIGWWGFTFPLGVYSLATLQIGTELPSAFFKILGTVFSVVVIILWLIVSAFTIQRLTIGELLFAPCLKDVEGHEHKARQNLRDDDSGETATRVRSRFRRDFSPSARTRG